jgi:hypothetical protein
MFEFTMQTTFRAPRLSTGFTQKQNAEKPCIVSAGCYSVESRQTAITLCRAEILSVVFDFSVHLILYLKEESYPN